MRNDTDPASKHLGVTTPFDIKLVNTDAILDPSIKMVDGPETKF